MNKLKKNALKCIKLSLAAFMLFTSVDMKVFAEDTEVVNETQTDEVEVLEETDVQNTTETVVEETVVETEEPIVEETVEVVEEQVEEEPQVDLSVLDDTDFTSGRLLVSEEALPEEAPVIGVLDGMALVQYETEESAKIAYLELSESADVVVDTNDFGVADDEVEEAQVETETPVETVLTEDNNPFAEVEKAEVENIKYDIAVIDTGAVEADGIVSVLGDDGIDYHGHGQNMINTIKGINPSAKVLSIKALDNTGVGGTSAIYAAIRIAIDNQVKIINLSISATKTEDNKIIEDIINEAVEKGIKVVGAAGNNNIDAVNTIPGGVESAIVIGASDDEGNRQPNSNFGETVDYLMPAKATSYASAKASAYLSLNRDLAEVVKEEKVDGIAHTEEQEPNEDFEVQPNDAVGGGASGASGGVTVDGDQVAGFEYVWWDRENRTDNTQPHSGAGTHYDWSDLTDANIAAEREFWIAKLTEKIKNSDKVPGNVVGYATPNVFPYADPNEYSNMMNLFDTAIRRALEQALLPRMNENDKARVVAVGVTYQKHASGDRWFLSYPLSSVPNPYNARNVIESMATDGEVFGSWFSTNFDPIPGRQTPKEPGQIYADYVYNAGTDSEDMLAGRNAYGEKYVYVIAVLDDSPGKTLTMTVNKVNENNKAIKGANLVLYKDLDGDNYPDGNEVVAQGWTDGKKPISISLDKDNPLHRGTLLLREHMAPPGYVKDTDQKVIRITDDMFEPGYSGNLSYVFKDYPIVFRKRWVGITAQEVKDKGLDNQFEFKVYAGDVSNAIPTSDTWCATHSFNQPKGCLIDKWTGTGDHFIGNQGKDNPEDWDTATRRLVDDNTYTVVESKVPTGYTKFAPIVFKAVNSDNLIISNPDTTGAGWVWNANKKVRLVVGTNNYTVDLKINKKVANAFTEYVKNNPNYDLAGTEFTVYYDSAMRNTDIAKDINGNNVVLKVKKNSDGTYSTDTVKVKRNGKTTLYAKETKTGKGYKKDLDSNGNPRKYTIDINGKTSATLTVDNEPLRDPLTLQIRKVANGNDIDNILPMSGAVFELRYYPLDVSNGQTYTKEDLASKTPIKTIRGTTKLLTAEDTDLQGLIGKYGINFTKLVNNLFGDGTTNLPLGVYAVEEITPAPGYLKSKTKYVKSDSTVLVESDNTIIIHAKQQDRELTTFVVNDAGKSEDVSFQDAWEQYEPSEMTGSFDFTKVDKELKKVINQGQATFEGAKFNLINDSDYTIFYANKGDEGDYTKYIPVEKGQVVKELIINKEGKCDDLPMTLSPGDYKLVETTSSPGRLTVEPISFRVEATTDNTNNEVITFDVEEPLIRGDIRFTKVNEDGNMRPNTPFLIAALDKDGKIIESHVIVTDSSGVASTAFNYNIVSGNNTVSTKKEVRKHSYETNGFDKYVKKNADGSYSVTEEGEALLASGEASKYGIWFSQGIDVNTGKIVKNEKSNPNDEDGALYYGQFKIIEVHCKENKDLGEDLLISEVFSIDGKNSEMVDGVLVETNANVGENQISYKDVFVDLEVLLDTRAKDVITDTQTTFADKEVVLSDTISFSNLKSTSTYKWKVKFVETETNNLLSEVVVDRFKPEKTNTGVNTTNQPKMAFTVKTDGTITPATNIDGTVNKGYQGNPEVTSTGNVDTTGLGGKSISVVVELYEYITGYDFDSEEDYKEFEAINFITSHNTDRKDENEKIYIPKIETVAQDKFTKDHVGTKHKEDSIKDTVKLTNISPKEKYQLVAYVWDLDEDKLFSDKKVVKDFYSDRANVSHIEDLTVEMPEFELDSSNFADKTLVVFEELWRVDDSGKPVDEYPVAVHTDKLDEDQSIHYIDIDTELTDEFTGDHVGTVAEKVTLTDKVDLKNLLKGMEYTIKGDLVYRADGTTKDGKTVKAGDPVPVLEGSQTEVKFTPEESGNHTVYITYIVDSRNLEGIDVVSTEEAYHNDVLIDRHYDLEDDDQTVNFPKVGTVAVDSKTNDNVGTVLEDGTIIDAVEVCNLVPGEDYTITGKLVLQEDGSELVDVVSEPYSFTATEEQEGCSFVEITFKNVDATKIVGKSVVAFEYLTHTSKKTNEPVEVAKHEDIEDDAQTVHFPDVRTEATDRRTGDKVGSIFGKVTNAIRKFFGQDVLDEDETEIIDKVILTNLALDKTYTVKGKLMDQETGELLNGQEITAEDEVYVGKDGTLKAKNGSKVVVTNYDEKNHQVDGYIELVFKLGTDEITNKSVVVFEKLFHKNSKTGEDIEVNKHEDPNDEAQFVNLIEVDSVAVDSNTLTHMGDTPNSDLPNTKIIETFNMRKLVNGQDYKVDFALVVREESAKQGKPIYLAEDGSFTDDRTKAMTKVVEFKALAEKEVSGWRVIVNGEELFVGETHDEVQAFYNEYLSNLTDEEKAKAEVYLIEKFTEMQPDEEAFSAGATLEVEFDIKRDTVKGYTLVVVADTYHNDTIVAIHNDIYNELESVHYPNIGTKAEITDTEKDVKARKVRVLDTVSYTNLTPGVKYTLVARGVNPDTGKVIVKANGDEYVFTKTFTPTKPNGKEAVEMLFDRDDIESYKLVAFEKLFINYGLDGELEVARHEDLEDENQTVVLYQKVKLTVNKKSKDTKMPLKGAEITVFDSKNEVVLDKDNKEAVQLTDEKGQVEFEIYMYVNEQYYARETKAPEGYALNTDKFNIAIVDKRVEEVEINIEILDELLIIVPPTGVDGKLLIGAGVVLLATIIALGYVLVKKKNTDTHKH